MESESVTVQKITLPKKEQVVVHPRKPIHWKDYLVKFGFYVGVVGIWELIALFHVWPPYILPSPVSVAQTLYYGFEDKSLLFGIGISMERLIIGYSIAIVLGVLLGLALGRVRYLEQSVGSAVLGLQTLPSITWLPAAILLVGLHQAAIIFVVFMGSFLSIAISTEAGVKHIPPLFIKNAGILGIKGWRLYWEVILPASLPSIITGMKLGWSFAWRSLMAGEMLFVNLGLGYLLQLGRDLNDMSLIFAVMVIIVAIGMIVDHLIFGLVEKAVKGRWGLLVEEH